MKIKSWAETKLTKQVKLIKILMLLQSFFTTAFLMLFLSDLPTNADFMAEVGLSNLAVFSGFMMLLGAFSVLIFGVYTLLLLGMIIFSNPKAFWTEEKAKIKEKFKRYEEK